jgi:2-polyprenyl-3-methyl-5-hydroxy-6-metoxy-1,4-benzoquinol methylase
VTIASSQLLDELRAPARALRGLGALKTRFRPLVCPLGHVLEEVPRGARLFDIGCGSGTLLYLAARLRGVAAAHGYDVSREAIDAAAVFQRRAADLHVQWRPPGALPELGGYDIVTLVDVLHHIPPAEQITFLERICAGMDGGAKLVVLDINAARRLPALCNQLHDLLLARQWVHPMRPERVAAALAAAGARVAAPVFTDTLWYSHYLIVAEKPAPEPRP